MLMIAPLLVVAHWNASAQKEIEAMYRKWDTAIIKRDQKAMNEVLADTFKAKRKNGKKPLTKKEFIEGIAARWKTDAPKETAFTTKIKTLTSKEDTYFATVQESITFAPVKGKSEKISFTSIDTWQKFGKGWKITQTEPGD